MHSDFDIIAHSLPRDLEYINLYPVADLHVGAREFLSKAWRDFAKKILADEHSYITIHGDVMNNALKSSKSNTYDDTMRPREQKEWLKRELEPFKEKILCVVPGNHERRSTKDADDEPLYDVCQWLGIEDRYRENMAVVILSLGERSNKQRQITYTLGVTHGAGGGGQTGSGVNRIEAFSRTIEGLDIMVMGHTHKPAVTRPNALEIDVRNKKLLQKDRVTMITSPWLAYGGYALAGMMVPSGSRPQMLRLDGTKKDMTLIW